MLDVRWPSGRVRWSLVAGLVRAVVVIVPGVFRKNAVGVGGVHDQDVVEDFAA